jgi:hypothetical protein
MQIVDHDAALYGLAGSRMLAPECVTMHELCYPGSVRMENGSPIIVVVPRLMAWRAWN